MRCGLSLSRLSSIVAWSWPIDPVLGHDLKPGDGGRRLFSSGDRHLNEFARVCDRSGTSFFCVAPGQFDRGRTFVSGPRDADEAITQLIAVLDTPELAAAMNRMERGYGLRVVK